MAQQWRHGNDPRDDVDPSSNSGLTTERAVAAIVIGAAAFLVLVNRGFARVLPRFGGG